MKLVFILIHFLLIPIFSFAQKGEGPKIEPIQVVKNDFLKMDQPQLNKLMPFRLNNKWGYINMSNKKVIISPKYDKANFFTPDALIAYKKNKYLVTSDSVTPFNYKLPDLGVGNLVFEATNDEDLRGVYFIKGFKLNNTEEIESYNARFLSINGPIKINNKNYAIVSMVIPDTLSNRELSRVVQRHLLDEFNLKKYHGIIDEEKNVLEGFEFKFQEIVPIRESKDSFQWFYFKDSGGISGFINDKGEKRLYNESVSYPLRSDNKFGYTIQKKDGLYGVLDYVNMDWVIELQKNKIISISYASDKLMDNTSFENREKANIYFLMEEGPLAFYIDIKGKKYIPRKLRPTQSKRH